LLPNATVIQSNPLGHGILKREEIARFDVLMAMGASMERNILISVLAKQFGIPMAMALVDRIDLKASVERTLVDDAVVPNLLMVKTISNLLKGGGPLGAKTLQREEIMFKEINVTKKMRGVGKRLGGFYPAISDFIIAGIIEDGKGFVPSDDHIISEGQRLFLLYYPSGIRSISRWLLG
jgi:Trk K+ transport system NAD-binding subunit